MTCTWKLISSKVKKCLFQCLQAFYYIHIACLSVCLFFQGDYNVTCICPQSNPCIDKYETNPHELMIKLWVFFVTSENIFTDKNKIVRVGAVATLRGETCVTVYECQQRVTHTVIVAWIWSQKKCVFGCLHL